jgi:hypothetical protein
MDEESRGKEHFKTQNLKLKTPKSEFKGYLGFLEKGSFKVESFIFVLSFTVRVLKSFGNSGSLEF